jgi:catechol 2,3-dioxygenase-like lactoylglutathione lyase family enzyme
MEAPMLAKRIHHVSFAVRHLETSRAFYESVLGLEPVDRPDIGLPGAWYAAGDAQIHLIAAPEGADVGAPPAKLTPLANHSAFAIDSYDAALAFLKGRGAEIFETKPEIGQLWIRDPDGNVIELIDPRGRGAGAA